MLRSLTHYWRVNLAVVAGASIATAVLAGAVVVGDSLQASLKRLTVDRLGDITWALLTEEPFREALAVDLETGDGAGRVAPALLSSASVVHTESRALAAGVSLMGVDERFAAYFSAQGEALTTGLERASGQIFPSVAINRSLARELQADVGDDVLLSFEQTTEIPRESLLGNRPAAGETTALRATVSTILPDRGPGRFSVTSHQGRSLIAYVELGVLQSRLDLSGRVNALFSDTTSTAFPATLASAITLQDLGIESVEQGNLLRLSNRRFVLRDATVEAIERVADQRQLPHQQVLGYLANQINLGTRSIPYSMVLGIEAPVSAGLGDLLDANGSPVATLGDDQILLGEWAAEELLAQPGDIVEVVYFEVGPNDELRTQRAELTVVGSARMEGLMVDASVLPDFPGIAEADDMAGWDPPFPMDLGSIRPRDEQFWDQYGAAPKAIVGLNTAQRLWGNRFGRTTTVRVAADSTAQGLLLADLRPELDLDAFGFAAQPVREQGLAASRGATDFSGLFLAFSVFLIAAAGLVVALLFSLSVELRAREVGLRRAVGFPLAKVRRRLLGEGLVLALFGGMAGIGLAILYAAVLIRVIADLWADTLDLPLLTLELVPAHIASAAAGAVAFVAFTVVLTLRRLRRLPIPALLAGATRLESASTRNTRSRLLAIGAALAGALMVGGAMFADAGASAGIFFTAGALFLIAGLAAFAAWLGSESGHATDRRPALARMAARNSAFNPGRSLLSVALVACATFMLVSVAANRRELSPESLDRGSGTGGFSLVARSDVPLRRSLSDATAADLNLSPTTIDLLQEIETFPLRFLPGDDASCLNLYQPEKPRVVGVPPAFIDRGGFDFSSAIEKLENPWTLLEQDLGPGVIPAIGDANSVMWILHSGLGEDIVLTDDHGKEVRLRLVGLLRKSIFQSELVIAEDAFVRHFPQHGGYSYFLLETDADRTEAAAAALEGDLATWGFDATSTVDKLARFLGIEEMYLSTFQLLGGLGLVLGTVGLGVVILRNVNERRRELAMLRAVGFRRRAIGNMILLETAFQLTCGLAIGSLAGFLALMPYFLDTSLHLPWVSLLGTLTTVLLVGMLSATAGVAAAVRAPLLPALKAD